jgi:uncharacterized OsmC-like protein
MKGNGTMSTTTTLKNGIDTAALRETMAAVKADPRKGLAEFGAKTVWKHAFRSESVVDGWSLGGERLPKQFTISIDEPRELLGDDSSPNPQEYLQAAMNACMLNTFVAVCSMLDVTLESLEFESRGQLDLRGFLGLDSSVPAGYEEIHYTIRVKGDGTPEQYAKAHQAMMATSPNYYNMNRAIRMNSELIVD